MFFPEYNNPRSEVERADQPTSKTISSILRGNTENSTKNELPETDEIPLSDSVKSNQADEVARSSFPACKFNESDSSEGIHASLVDDSDVEPSDGLYHAEKASPERKTGKIIAAILLSALLLVLSFFAASFLVNEGHLPHWNKCEASNSFLNNSLPFAREQAVLKNHPVVILISCDGFRFGYDLKVPTPNLDRIKKNGVVAKHGLYPVFPSLTFPNHYSIVTGLYPAHHGIISNTFQEAGNQSNRFFMNSTEPHWWGGEPLWVTAIKQNLTAATYFWPGSTVIKEPWNCPAGFCEQFDASVPFEERVDTILGWMDGKPPLSSPPNFITLYFQEPDEAGHEWGPDSFHLDEQIERVDKAIGRLLDGLEERKLLSDVHVIVLGDHGMTSLCSLRTIFWDKAKKKVPTFDESWVSFLYPLSGIVPPPSYTNDDVRKLYDQLKEVFSEEEMSGAFRLYLREALPERFKYSGSDRIPPILGLASEGYSVEYSKDEVWYECAGGHGFDNSLLSMRTIFMATGPRFDSVQGREIDSFINVEIYNMISEILGLEPAPNDGTSDFVSTVLLPVNNSSEGRKQGNMS